MQYITITEPGGGKMHKLIFSITTCNRSRISVPSIRNLLAAVPVNSLVVISDDGSNDPVLLTAIRHLQGASRHLILAPAAGMQHVGVEANNVRRCDILFPEYYNAWVYLTDDDMQFSGRFYESLIRLQQTLEQDPAILAGTLFHTQTHPVTGIYGNQYRIKASIGGCSLLIRVSDFLAAMHYYRTSYRGIPGWDWAICSFARKHKRILLATNRSYVQHLGKKGVNSQPWRYDHATDFLP